MQALSHCAVVSQEMENGTQDGAYIRTYTEPDANFQENSLHGACSLCCMVCIPTDSLFWTFPVSSDNQHVTFVCAQCPNSATNNGFMIVILIVIVGVETPTPTGPQPSTSIHVSGLVFHDS